MSLLLLVDVVQRQGDRERIIFNLTIGKNSARLLKAALKEANYRKMPKISKNNLKR